MENFEGRATGLADKRDVQATLKEDLKMTTWGLPTQLNG